MSGLPPIGVIGGSGLYTLFDAPLVVDVAPTPFGAPSGPLTRGSVAGREVVFVPRHGPGHEFPPHLLPSRATLWALRDQGVHQVFSLSAVGSLDPELGIGALVVPDQILDRTSGRDHTFFDHPAGVQHAPFADPYCPVLRAAAVPGTTRSTGTLAVINGPRFSTRAESADLRRSGASLAGMTAMPEAGLAREIGLCYATLALVTDQDAGVASGEGVTQEQVFVAFRENLPRLRDLLVGAITALPPRPDCPCAGYGSPSLAGAPHTTAPHITPPTVTHAAPGAR